MTDLESAAGHLAPFDRRLLRRRRDRAAAGFEAHDFLVREVAARLVDRLGDFNRDFGLVLDLGCHRGEFGESLASAPLARRVECLVHADLSERMAAQAQGLAVAADEEALPFAGTRFDLVVSAMSLHWVNDLPGTLVQIRRILKPDGLFLAALPGIGTLSELREAWLAAEAEEEGGASPRVSPFVEMREAAGLLDRAGFAMPVADTDHIPVTYDNPIALMRELKGMGEANLVVERRRTPTRRATLLAAAARYAERFAGPDGRIPASFEIVYLTGWAPHPDQPAPLRPGSATARLADALGARELPAGEKAKPR